MGACSGDAPVQLTALQKEVKDIEDKLKKETENNEMYFKGHNNKSNELMELKTRKAVVLVESGTALAQYRNYFDPSVDASGPSLQWLPVELLSIIIEQVDSPSDLIALCLVSKTIYPFAKAKLWRSLSLQGLDSDGYAAFTNTLTTVVNSSPENLECIKKLNIVGLDCEYAMEATTHVDPLIRVSNSLIALAVQRMPELRSFIVTCITSWGTSNSISRTILESLHHCHHLRSLSIDMENIDFPCPETVPTNHHFPDIQSLLCVPQFSHLVKITFVGISSLSVMRACCHLVSQNKTVKYLSLSFPDYWAEYDEFPSDLLEGAIPIGSWEDSRSCNLREMATCIKEVLQSVELVSLELIGFVWELSMLQLPRCIILPTLKHLRITGNGTDNFFREIAKRLQSSNDSLQLRSLALDAELQMTSLFLKGLRDLQSFSFTGTFRPFTSLLEGLCLGHGRTMERLKIFSGYALDRDHVGCTPGDIDALAAGMQNICELHIEIAFVDGWAIPFKRFRKLRVLFLTSSGGIIAPSHSEIITLLQTFADVVFSDVIFSREQKPRLEYLKVARWGGIYQPVKSEEGRYKFKLVEHKWAESIFEGW